MALSLSSLLNPSPEAVAVVDADADTDEERLRSPHPPHPPPPPHVPSPEQYQAASPSHMTSQGAVSTFSSTNAPPPLQSQWYGEQSHSRPSTSHGSRPTSSGRHDTVQLPPPTMRRRKMSSPTLQQYILNPQSPDRRRVDTVTRHTDFFTLAPLQGLAASDTEQSTPTASASLAHQRISPPFAASASSLPTPQSHSVPLQPSLSNDLDDTDDEASSPAAIYHEAVSSPQPSPLIEPGPPSPATAPSLQPAASPQPGDWDPSAPAHSAPFRSNDVPRKDSPLRRSSVPVLSTEVPTLEAAMPAKRPAPVKTKKGVAKTTTTKRAAPTKKRKIELGRSDTPSRAAKIQASKLDSGKANLASTSHAPSPRSQTTESDEALDDDDDDDDEEMEDADNDEDGGVYCICRKPDNGTFMIGCDGTCDDWYHGKCVGIEQRDKNLIDKYICPTCTATGIGMTTWKRMCRRIGCRLPAKVGTGKERKDRSKYCSEECGIMFFREMCVLLRGHERRQGKSGGRRKMGRVESSDQLLHADDDLGALGGVLAAGEVKSLLDSSSTAEDFQNLGENALNPRATVGGKNGLSTSTSHVVKYTIPEQNLLRSISLRKDHASICHQRLKDRIDFVHMAKQAAAQSASDRGLKSKEYCGYDSRIEWSNDRFSAWRDSHAGRRAFDLRTLVTDETETAAENGEKRAAPDVHMDKDADVDDNFDFAFETCARKKCPRHAEWVKLAQESLRHELHSNSDSRRTLDKDEATVHEKATLRARRAPAGEGEVEVHRVRSATRAESTTGDDREHPSEVDIEWEERNEAMEVDGVGA